MPHASGGSPQTEHGDAKDAVVTGGARVDRRTDDKLPALTRKRGALVQGEAKVHLALVRGSGELVRPSCLDRCRCGRRRWNAHPITGSEHAWIGAPTPQLEVVAVLVERSPARPSVKRCDAHHAVSGANEVCLHGGSVYPGAAGLETRRAVR